MAINWRQSRKPKPSTKLVRETRFEVGITRGSRLGSHIVDVLREKLPDEAFTLLHDHVTNTTERREDKFLTRWQNRDNYSRAYEGKMIKLVRSLISRGKLMSSEQYEVLLREAVKRNKAFVDEAERRRSELKKQMKKRASKRQAGRPYKVARSTG